MFLPYLEGSVAKQKMTGDRTTCRENPYLREINATPGAASKHARAKQRVPSVNSCTIVPRKWNKTRK